MFITFEGSEGSGKSCQLALLAGALRQAGCTVLTTREPGGTPIGDQVRSVLFDFKNQDMLPRTEILLFQASRCQLVEQVIRPRLAKGEIVLCDRYADSTLAYQGYGYGLDLALLRPVVEFATSGLQPDLTLFLDLPIEVGLRRRQQGGDLNRLDAYETAFYERVRQGYVELAQADPQRWVTIDAEPSITIVQAAVRAAVFARLA